MDKFRVNTNGERDGRAVAEENPEAENSCGRVTSHQSQSSQFQPDNHRVDEERFSFPGRASVDLQTLESSFGRLSFSDSSVPQNGNPIHNRYNQLINGGGGGGGEYRFPPRELESQQMNQLERLLLQNNCVNGSYANAGQASTSVMHNNAFLNGNLPDFPYPSRNRLSDQSPWDYTNGFVSGINNSLRSNQGFGFTHDPLPPMENGINSILSFAKDGECSRQLVENIVDSSRETFDVIFRDLIVHVCELMVDPFGNDVVQNLVEKSNSEQLTLIVDMVTKNLHQFVHICLDPLGTRAIQLLLRNIRLRSVGQILRIVGAISMVALQLARNNNAKHVIVSCFNEFPLSHCRNLLEVIARNCYWIAIDQHGCCMLQHCLIKECHELRRRLISEIIANALKLCLNCYGNYVVQYVVELEIQEVTALLVRQLAGSYPYLSRNKYGSHAVQKFLKIKDIDSRFIVQDLLREIDTLLLDPYGNYVIQTAWLVSKDDVRIVLRWHIESNIRLMRCNKFGKKILEKLNL